MLKENGKNEVRLFEVITQALTKFCVAYPNTYKIAMANLGFMSVQYLLNSCPLALCERAFLPSEKKENESLKKKSARLCSFESKRPLTDFDVLAFSISFENDYINIVKMLKLAGLPVYAKERGDDHPLVVAGGIATFLNPEPIADFFDAFLLGDSPDMIRSFAQRYAELKGSMTKEELLCELSKIKGVYVPSLYDVEYNGDGSIMRVRPVKSAKPYVEAAMSTQIEPHPAYSHIISKDAAFGDMFLIEISRGCRRFCRFCAAGYNYLPYKKLSVEKVMEIVKMSGGRKIGLVGAAVSDYEEIDELCGRLCSEGRNFSVSSFRADSLTDALLDGLKKSGHKTLTIAPEAGSQRMRDVINKGVTEKDILGAAHAIADSGILNVKLYYIVGLPFESDTDVDAIIILTRRVRDVFLEASKKFGRAGRVTVSISPFVPKARTPFVFKGMDSEKELKRKIKIIAEGLGREPNITLEKVSIKDAVLEAVLARGSRRLAAVIESMAGGKKLKQSAQEHDVDIGFYAARDIPFDEILPFDHIVSGIKKPLLQKDYEKARCISGERS